MNGVVSMSGTADNQKERNKAITEGVNNQMKCQRTANGRSATVRQWAAAGSIIREYVGDRTERLVFLRQP
jgi:hypothetical protein